MSTPPERPELDEVATLAAELADTQAKLRRAAIDAVAAGCGEVCTAQAAGVARMTLRRWIKDHRN